MKGACILMTLTLALAAASCATVPPPAPGTTSSPMPGHDPVPVTSSAAGRSGGTASPMPGAAPAHPSAAHVSALVDSQPSREALAVLNTIPEPLGPGERVAAPSKGAIAADISADEDSAGVAAAAGDSAQVPTPAPTQALGDRPGSLKSAPPSSPPSSAPAAAAAAAASTAAAGKSVNPDSCWRVQVGAPPEEDKANAVRAAAQSQLQVPFVIEVEGGLRKVRTRECLDMTAAEALRRRALGAGFEGAFRVKGPHK